MWNEELIIFDELITVEIHTSITDDNKYLYHIHYVIKIMVKQN